MTDAMIPPVRCDIVLLLSLIRQESGFNPQIVNPNSGAAGLMQLMPATFKEHATRAGLRNPDVFNPLHNIIAGCLELNRCIDIFKDMRLGLTAYNWGLGNLADLIKQAGTRDFDKLKTFVGKKWNKKTQKEEDWKMPKEAQEYAMRIFRHYADPETAERIDDYKTLTN